MKRVIFFVLLLFPVLAFAQSDSPLPEPTQEPNATYRIFRTENIYTLLKLDTRTGQIWQVQWGMDEDHRFTATLNSTILVPVGTSANPTKLIAGRFTLCPTSNIFTFVLLDTQDGRTWQVQWGDVGKRFILAIQ
jgi:hypothetical protein